MSQRRFPENREIVYLTNTYLEKEMMGNARLTQYFFSCHYKDTETV